MAMQRAGQSDCGARPVRRGGSTPLWRQLHDDLIRRVGTGEFDDAFPGELVLAEQYGVSRQTVREALRRLRDAGVVRGERGRSSRLVEPAEISQPIGTLYSMFASVEAAGQEQRSIVRCLDVRTDEAAAARLGVVAETPLFHLERLRLAGGRPLATDRVWLDADLAEPLLDADFTQTALYRELETRCGVRITRGEETIRAVNPTAAERRLLGMPAATAAFVIERLTYAGERPLEWRHTLIRADRFALSASFEGDEGLWLSDAARPLP